MQDTSRTVANALRLLSSFSRSHPVMTGSQLAAEIDLPRTSVLRLLATLESAGFVERAENGTGYQIGISAFEVGTQYLARNPLSSILVATLDALVEQTQCTAYLGILDGADLVILTCREGTRPVRFVWREGDRLPCTTTAMGKAILMHLGDDEIAGHLGPVESLSGLTEHSLKTRRQLDRELAEASERGWACACEESHAGLTAVAAAILDGGGSAVAAISVSFFDHPPDPNRKAEYSRVVREAATRASRRVAEFAFYGNELPREHSAYLGRKIRT